MKKLVLLVSGALACAGLALQAAAQTPSPSLTGEVLEVQSVPNYTYLRLKTREGEIWAAVPATSVAKGAHVELVDPAEMENFEAKALGKKFERIVFATLAAPRVARSTAADGRTVAQTIADAAALAGTTVTIRGQVVKYSPGILGRNWVHLQDGSGTPQGATHDILVTTTETTAIGEVIDARGTVRTNVDFGSGYTYAVLVEDASIRKPQ